MFAITTKLCHRRQNNISKMTECLRALHFIQNCKSQTTAITKLWCTWQWVTMSWLLKNDLQRANCYWKLAPTLCIQSGELKGVGVTMTFKNVFFATQVEKSLIKLSTQPTYEYDHNAKWMWKHPSFLCVVFFEGTILPDRSVARAFRCIRGCHETPRSTLSICKYSK